MSKLIKTDAYYSRWIQELKDRYRCAQIKAATRVHQELLRFYWSVGRDIVARDAENKYGSGFMTAVNHLVKTEQDNPTIGLLICKDNDNVLAQYALESSSQPIGVAEFQLTKFIPDEFKSTLPTIEDIDTELK